MRRNKFASVYSGEPPTANENAAVLFLVVRNPTEIGWHTLGLGVATILVVRCNGIYEDNSIEETRY